MANRWSHVSLLCLFLIGFAGCDSQKTLQDTINQQNDSFTKGRMEELKPAEGTYKGTVHLADADQDFDCVIEIKRTIDFTRSPEGPDQTQTVSVPKLGGSMRFSALDKASETELSSYASLVAPMGGLLAVMFDYGDYNPRTQEMDLPYTVSDHSKGSFGELDGTLVNGHFQGTWFSKPFGTVGTFDFIQQISSAPTPAGDTEEAEE